MLPPPAPTRTCTLFSSFYAAPEILAKSRVGEGYDPLKSDIWSCGVILYCMLTGRAPFRVAVPEDPSFARLVIEGAYPFPRTLSQSARDLLGYLLSVDPAGRPAAEDILKSEWCSLTAAYDTPWFACQGPVERPLLSSSRPPSRPSASSSKRRKTEDGSVGGAGGAEGGGAEQSSFIEPEGKEAPRSASESTSSDGGVGGGLTPVTSDEEEIFMVGSVIHPLGWGGIPGGPSTVDVCIGRIEAVLSAHFGEQNKRRSTSGAGGSEGGSAGGSEGGGGGASGGGEDGDEVIHVGIRGSVVFVGNMRTAMAVTVVAETKETVRICQRVSKRVENFTCTVTVRLWYCPC